MPLNLYTGGSAVPHIRYMAGTSSWALSTEQGTQTINLPRCVFDLGNIRTGWGIFAENTPPEWVWDESLEKMADKPKDGREWKRGFGINILLPQEFGDGRLREFATTGTGAVEGIKALYAQYEEQYPAHRGQVPVVEYRGAETAQFGKGRTNVPTLVITDWIDRPAALDEVVQNPPQHVPSQAQQQPPVQTPPAQAATAVQPPQPDSGALDKPVF